ncbi:MULTISPECIES: FlgO family outer membrane protein [Gammaproteobacteria]|uniref:FlgO family outer membrane protein n=1 Tax=Gammaproteobacteria TaxID=1236 RepID=UPI000DD032DB|nr:MULTISPECIES: FlgO family outer membrane protein [Gammaproteobacteria]RTE86562.1 hypothetical protein DQX04_08385 [Aliidiomarina sp. B3213]TCZ90883.1 hypothetical protein EYQ95_08660 [Lysobacter sp. N42]
MKRLTQRAKPIAAVLLALSFTATLVGCASAPEQSMADRTPAPSAVPHSPLTQYENILAHELFQYHEGIRRVAVTSFVPAESLQHQASDSYSDLARQMQEGLMASARPYNIGFLEYRLTQALQLTDEQELMLSRDTERLRDNYMIDWVVVGTYSEVDNGLLVNTRLVNARSALVISSSTVLVPWETISSDEVNSQWRRGGLYRSSHLSDPQPEREKGGFLSSMFDAPGTRGEIE